MKPKTILLIFLTLTLHISGYSQSCLPEGITFTLQSQIDEFQNNHPECNLIEGDVMITNDDIINLDGLAQIEGFEGSLKIMDCNNLTDLSGLENVLTIGQDFYLQENALLEELNGLNALNVIGGSFFIRANIALQSLIGLEGLSTINGSIIISSNPSLPSLMGLSGLEEVFGDLVIYNCNGQNDGFLLEGTTSLTHIHGRLSIEYNDVILFGFHNLEEVSGDLNIFYSPNLETINGFESLTTIGGTLNLWHNVNLTDISTFASVDAGSIENLYITENISLSECAILSVCEYLANPNGSVQIHINAPGCSSEEEVLEACSGVGVLMNDPGLDVEIFPNPTCEQLTISGLNKKTITELNIYNLTGGLVLKEPDPGLVIEISSLIQGIYIVEIIQGHAVMRTKLFVK